VTVSDHIRKALEDVRTRTLAEVGLAFLKAQGTPPRPGLVFDKQKHRWVRPNDGRHQSRVAPGVTYGNRDDRDSDDRHFRKETKKAKAEVEAIRGQLEQAIAAKENHEKLQGLQAKLKEADAKVKAAREKVVQLTRAPEAEQTARPASAPSTDPRHNPDLDAAFGAPSASPPPPDDSNLRHNPDLDAVFGASVPEKRQAVAEAVTQPETITPEKLPALIDALSALNPQELQQVAVVLKRRMATVVAARPAVPIARRRATPIAPQIARELPVAQRLPTARRLEPLPVARRLAIPVARRVKSLAREDAASAFLYALEACVSEWSNWRVVKAAVMELDDPIATMLEEVPDEAEERLEAEAEAEGLGDVLRWVKAFDPDEYERLLQDVEDEWELERVTKGDRSHLVRKVITNRLGNRQVVWVKPAEGETHRGQSAGQAADEGVQTHQGGAKELTAEQKHESHTIVAMAVSDPNKLNPEQAKNLIAHVHALNKEEAKGLLRVLGQKVSGLQMDVAQRLVDAIKAGREKGHGVGDALQRAGNKVSGQYGAWGQAAGGTGGKPEASRDEFPKRGVGPGEKVEGVTEALKARLVADIDASDVPRGYQYDHKKAAATACSRMSDKAAGLLSKNLSKLTVSNERDLLDQFIKEHPEQESLKRLKQMGATVPAAYNRQTGEVVVGKETNPKRLAQNHAHEYAHVIDGDSFSFSNTEEWRQAWEKEMAGGGLSNLGAASTFEGFAEFGMCLWTGAVDEDTLKQKFPESYQVFQEFGLAKPNGSTAGDATVDSGRTKNVNQPSVGVDSGSAHSADPIANLASDGAGSGVATSDGPQAHPDDAELASLNRKPFRSLTPAEKARRAELSAAWGRRKNPDATPILTGGGKGPGGNGESENEGTAHARKVAESSPTPPPAHTLTTADGESLSFAHPRSQALAAEVGKHQAAGKDTSAAEVALGNVSGAEEGLSDRDHRRLVARRLQSAHRDAVRLGKHDAAEIADSLLTGEHVGAERIGEVGSTVPFNPVHHESDSSVSTGAPVTVRSHGHRIVEGKGGEYVLGKAKVGATNIDKPTPAGKTPAPATGGKPMTPAKTLLSHTDDEIAAKVNEAARTAEYGSGPNKAFISDVYDDLKKSHPELTLPEFKEKLLALNAKAKVNLNRVDMPQDHHPDDVLRSHTLHPSGAGEFHFVKVDGRAGGEHKKNRKGQMKPTGA
jgi:hypothetical protein